MCIDPANRYLVCCLWWLIDRGKWISLNSGFIERFLHKRCIHVEIVVVVSRRHGFYLEEFFVNVVITALLPFCKTSHC